MEFFVIVLYFFWFFCGLVVFGQLVLGDFLGVCESDSPSTLFPNMSLLYSILISQLLQQLRHCFLPTSSINTERSLASVVERLTTYVALSRSFDTNLFLLPVPRSPNPAHLSLLLLSSNLYPLPPKANNYYYHWNWPLFHGAAATDAAAP